MIDRSFRDTALATVAAAAVIEDREVSLRVQLHVGWHLADLPPGAAP
jgi:hypothetical protein